MWSIIKGFIHVKGRRICCTKFYSQNFKLSLLPNDGFSFALGEYIAGVLQLKNIFVVFCLDQSTHKPDRMETKAKATGESLCMTTGGPQVFSNALPRLKCSETFVSKDWKIQQNYHIYIYHIQNGAHTFLEVTVTTDGKNNILSPSLQQRVSPQRREICEKKSETAKCWKIVREGEDTEMCLNKDESV